MKIEIGEFVSLFDNLGGDGGRGAITRNQDGAVWAAVASEAVDWAEDAL